MVVAYFLDVGQGNMVVIVFPNNSVVIYDCNITQEKEKDIFTYLKKIMPKKSIDIFINSHRDADHMRGIKKLNKNYPINTLWDSGVSGNTETEEYKQYMQFRRNVPKKYEISAGDKWSSNNYLKFLNGKRKNLNDVNAQSLVAQIDYDGTKLLLTGDTDAKAWKDYIMPDFKSEIQSHVILGSHHGSITFFDDPRDKKNYYTSHIRTIKPDITIISVGKNPHGHPKKEAIEFYEKYSSGSDKGNKVFRTDKKGNMKLTLKGKGSWNLKNNQ